MHKFKVDDIVEFTWGTDYWTKSLGSIGVIVEVGSNPYPYLVKWIFAKDVCKRYSTLSVNDDHITKITELER
jgi:hypothetical protein